MTRVVTCNVHRAQDDSGRLLVYEPYKDRNVCDAHLSREPIKRLIATTPVAVYRSSAQQGIDIRKGDFVIVRTGH